MQSQTERCSQRNHGDWEQDSGFRIQNSAPPSPFAFLRAPRGGNCLVPASATKNQEPRTTNLTPARRAGFTLMEVNLALLIMAVGLLGIFSLFPVGLRQSNATTADTAQATFATMLFNAMRANAQIVTNWNDWLVMTNGVNFGIAVTAPTTGGCGIMTPTAGASPLPNLEGQVNNYLIAGQTIRVKLTLAQETDPRIITACLQTTPRLYTSITNEPKYATSFVYLGM